MTGKSVNIDPASGMIVPAGNLSPGAMYTVHSGISTTTFAQVKASRATPDTATPTVDTQLPGGLRTTLDQLIKAFVDETGIPSSPALPFLQALQKDLQTKYLLSSAAQGSSTGTVARASPTPSSSGTATTSAKPTTTPKPSTSKTATSGKPHSSHTNRADQVRPLGSKPTSKSAGKASHRTTAKATSHPPAKHSTSRAASTPPPTPSPTSAPPTDVAGSTGFADVLASIVGSGRSGTPEQFATLIALVARELGIPARVVTGFRIPTAPGETTVAAGQHNVTTADAWTWTEIPLVGSGWVVLDASPTLYSQNPQQTESAAAPPSSKSVPPSQNALVTQNDNGHAVAKKSPVPSTSSAPNEALLVALLVAIGVLLFALLLVLVSRKRVRAARRRRSPDPRTRLIGAWQESLDVLSEAGLPELTTLTSSEIADLTDEQFGAESGERTRALGTAANAVAYSVATVIAPAEADAAWSQQRTLRKAVRRQLGVRGRMAASLRYHRPKQAERPTSPASWADATAAARSASRRVQRRRYRGRRRAH